MAHTVSASPSMSSRQTRKSLGRTPKKMEPRDKVDRLLKDHRVSFHRKLRLLREIAVDRIKTVERKDLEILQLTLENKDLQKTVSELTDQVIRYEELLTEHGKELDEIKASNKEAGRRSPAKDDSVIALEKDNNKRLAEENERSRGLLLSGKRIKSLTAEVERKEADIESLEKEIDQKKIQVHSFEQEIILCREERRKWDEEPKAESETSLEEQNGKLRKRLARAIEMAENAENHSIHSKTIAEIQQAQRDAADAAALELARAEEQREKALVIKAAKLSAEKCPVKDGEDESVESDADDDEGQVSQPPPTLDSSARYEAPKYQPWHQQYQRAHEQQQIDPSPSSPCYTPSAVKNYGANLPHSSRLQVYTNSSPAGQQQAPYRPRVKASPFSGLPLGGNLSSPGPYPPSTESCSPHEGTKPQYEEALGAKKESDRGDRDFLPIVAYDSPREGRSPGYNIDGSQDQDTVDARAGKEGNDDAVYEPLCQSHPREKDEVMSDMPAYPPYLNPDSMDRYREDEIMEDTSACLPTPSGPSMLEGPGPRSPLDNVEWQSKRGRGGRVSKSQLVPRLPRAPQDLVGMTLQATKRRSLIRTIFESAIVESRVQYAAQASPMDKPETKYAMYEAQFQQENPCTEQDVGSNVLPAYHHTVSFDKKVEGSMPGPPTTLDPTSTLREPVHSTEDQLRWNWVNCSNQDITLAAYEDSSPGSLVSKVTAAQYRDGSCQTEDHPMTSTGNQTAERPMTSSETQTAKPRFAARSTQTLERLKTSGETQTEEEEALVEEHPMRSRETQTEDPLITPGATWPTVPQEVSAEIEVRRYQIVSSLIQSGKHRIKMGMCQQGLRNTQRRYPNVLVVDHKEEHHPRTEEYPRVPIETEAETEKTARKPCQKSFRKVIKPRKVRPRRFSHKNKSETDKGLNQARCNGQRQCWLLLVVLGLLVILLVNLWESGRDCRLWFEANDVVRQTVLERRDSEDSRYWLFDILQFEIIRWLGVDLVEPG